MKTYRTLLVAVVVALALAVSAFSGALAVQAKTHHKKHHAKVLMLTKAQKEALATQGLVNNGNAKKEVVTKNAEIGTDVFDFIVTGRWSLSAKAVCNGQVSGTVTTSVYKELGLNTGSIAAMIHKEGTISYNCSDDKPVS